MYMFKSLLLYVCCILASRLCCPHFKFRACGCLQTYIIGDGKYSVRSKLFYLSLYLSVNVFSTAVLIEDTVNSETNIIFMKQKLVKNPNWQEADQLAIYKAWRS